MIVNTPEIFSIFFIYVQIAVEISYSSDLHNDYQLMWNRIGSVRLKVEFSMDFNSVHSSASSISSVGWYMV